MADTIFSKIISGDIPCHKVYEDEHVLAFLDIGPVAEGHTLVIPKEPAETLDKVKKVTGCEAFNVLQNNGPLAHQAVFHVHFHIIPKQGADSGLGVGWPAGQLEGERGKELAAALREAL
jgi:histidine triad (HIT) family protein